MTYKNLKIYTDGGARGNPGPAGIGVIIKSKACPERSRRIKSQKPVLSEVEGLKVVGGYSKYIGIATNNQAEYQAVVYGLERARQFKPEEVDVYSDSKLMVKQLNREYKIKNLKLGPLFIKIWNLQQSFKKVRFHYIPREKNKEADKLVNQAINKRSKKD